MINTGVQFFDGRGGSGGKGNGGGNTLGSTNNPVKSKDLNSMSSSEKVSALNAMPVGTKIRARPTGYRANSTTYTKTASGWATEYSYTDAKRRGRGGITRKSSYSTPSGHNWGNYTFDSVRYPNKK